MMKKTILYVIVVAAILGGAFYASKKPNKQEVVTVGDYKNTSYIIDGQKITLKNGISEVESAPGSASKTITKYFGNEIKKDLNGDDKEDIAFLITQETGGSGTFFYVVGALNTGNGYTGSDAVLLGDRISPQTTESGPQNSIIVNYMDRAFGEPMINRPSVGKSIRLILDSKTMQFAQIEQNFEGEADPSRMSLTMKTWKWVKTEYSDGKIIAPKKDSFDITLKKDGTFSASTDCNTINGSYVATKSTISFDKMFSTLMYCDGSQEADFKKMIDNTEQYLFTSKGELVFTLKFDSGSVYFK